MKYTIAKPGDIYLGNISIENVFINEIMPAAPGDFVKIYLFARLYGEIERPLTDLVMARELGVTQDRIKEAWNYWEENGVIRKLYQNSEGELDYTILFLSVKEALYGEGGEEETVPDQVETKGAFGSQAVKDLMKWLEGKFARTLSPQELKEVISWIEDLNMPPEVIMVAVTYSLEKNKTSFKYIGKILEGWSESGLKTTDSVEAHLEENDQRHFRYRRVMKALGFSRNPTESEMKTMDTWFDDMGFNMDKVLEACGETSGIPNPNIKYVNGVLKNWRKEAGEKNIGVNDKKPVSMATLNKYYNYLRNKAEKEADERRKEIYKKIPRIKEIDEEIRKLGADLSKVLILNGADGSGKDLSEKMEELADDRAIILTENNYEIGYTEVHYKCDKCNDTGLTDMGERCSCITERMEEAEEWQEKRKKA